MMNTERSGNLQGQQDLAKAKISSMGKMRQDPSWSRGHERRVVFRMLGVFLLLNACPFPAQAQLGESNIPACRKTTGTATISFVDSAGPTTVLGAAISTRSNLSASRLPVYLRNSGSIPLTRLCIASYFNDYTGKRYAPSLTVEQVGGPSSAKTSNSVTGIVCIDRKVKPGEILVFDVTFSADVTLLPISGTIVFGPIGETKEEEKNDVNSDHPCRVDAAPLTRGLVVATLSTSRYTLFPLGLWCLVAVIAVIACLFLGRRLKTPMSGPQWNFSSSFGTNITLGGSLLTLVSSSSLFSDYPHFMTKQTYTAFSLLFAGAAIIAPVLYTLLSKPVSTGNSNGASSVGYVGTVGLFVFAAALAVWAFLGQLTTVGFLFTEFAARGYIVSLNIWIFYVVFGLVGFGLIVYAWRTASFYLNSHAPSAIRSEAKVEATQKAASLKWNVL
jgi:hypothetical protein